MSTDFGQLRQLLHYPPCGHNWRQIWAILDAMHRGDRLDEATLRYAEHHLERWPDSLRRLPVGAVSTLPLPPQTRLLRQLHPFDLFGPRPEASSPEQLPALLRSAHLTGLRALHLGEVFVSNEALAAACENPALSDLTLLDLSSTGRWVPPPHDSRRLSSLSPLIGASFASSLRALNLSSWLDGPEVLRPLLQAGYPQLERLTLGDAMSAALPQLIEVQAFPRLRYLSLGYHHDEPRLWQQLTRPHHWQQLSGLHLRSLRGDPRALLHDQGPAMLERLEELFLNHMDSGGRGMADIVAHMPRLRRLCVRGRWHSEELMLIEILDRLATQQLEVLDLFSHRGFNAQPLTRLDSAGARALSRATQLGSLRTLRIRVAYLEHDDIAHQLSFAHDLRSLERQGGTDWRWIPVVRTDLLARTARAPGLPGWMKRMARKIIARRAHEESDA